MKYGTAIRVLNHRLIGFVGDHTPLLIPKPEKSVAPSDRIIMLLEALKPFADLLENPQDVMVAEGEMIQLSVDPRDIAHAQRVIEEVTIS